MKTHILGSGSIGCLWAAYLSHCKSDDHNLYFLDSRIGSIPKQSTSTVKTKRFSFDCAFEKEKPIASNFSIPSIYKTDIEKPIECLLVCTKSFNALEALRNLEEYLNNDTVVLLFQNGLGSQHAIIDAFPTIPIYAAVTTEGANKPENSQLIHAGKGSTSIGPLNEVAKNKHHLNTLKKHILTTRINDHLELTIVEDIWVMLWKKLVINCAINPYTAILNCPNGEVKNSDLFRDTWPKLRSELEALLTTANYPLPQQDIETLVFEVMNNTRQNISSMLQDIRANKITEINDINGFASNILVQNNIDSSINKQLFDAVEALTNKAP